MGQQVTTECQCNDGFFQLCVPDASNYEQHNEINDTLHPSYPGVPTQYVPSHQDLYGAIASPNHSAVHLEPSAPSMLAGAATTVQDDYTTVTGLAMPSPPSTPAQKDVRLPWYQRITHKDITSNLEDSEEMVYGEAFAVLLGGQSGYVGLDSAVMREFICANSTISTSDIDFELLKVASPDEGLSRDAFLALLREFPILEADSISRFLDLSTNGEDMGSEECRTGLLMFGQDVIASNVGQLEWEKVLDTVMIDAGVVVKMEQWIMYCKLMGRIVRLSRYVHSQKSAVNVSRSGSLGVMGGA